MSGFPILDLVIGLIFIFFLLSIICSSAVELWLSIRRTRAVMLAKWLRAIFNLQALDAHGVPMIGANKKPVITGQAIIDHCMVTALSPQGKSNSYLSAENFVTALLDKITVPDPSKNVAAANAKAQYGFIPPPQTIDDYIERIKETNVISAELQRTFLLFAYEAKEATPSDTSKSKLDIFREKLQKWYNLNGERLTGKMKRTTLPITLIIAIALTIGLNVDTVEICRYLSKNKEVTKDFANNVIKQINETQNASTASEDEKYKTTLKALKETNELNLPIGVNDRNDISKHLGGWIASVLAILLGAPFWFDMLNKIANLRSTGPRPTDSILTESGKDKKPTNSSV